MPAEVLVSVRDLALIKKACEKILNEPEEMINEAEAAKLLGKPGKPVTQKYMYQLRAKGARGEDGGIQRSCYTIGAGGNVFYNKKKLMGL